MGMGMGMLSCRARGIGRHTRVSCGFLFSDHLVWLLVLRGFRQFSPIRSCGLVCLDHILKSAFLPWIPNPYSNSLVAKSLLILFMSKVYPQESHWPCSRSPDWEGSSLPSKCWNFLLKFHSNHVYSGCGGDQASLIGSWVTSVTTSVLCDGYKTQVMQCAWSCPF